MPSFLLACRLTLNRGSGHFPGLSLPFSLFLDFYLPPPVKPCHTHRHFHTVCSYWYRNSTASSVKGTALLQRDIGTGQFSMEEGWDYRYPWRQALEEARNWLLLLLPLALSRSGLECVHTGSVQPGESLLTERTRRQGVPLSYPRGGEAKLASKNFLPTGSISHFFSREGPWFWCFGFLGKCRTREEHAGSFWFRTTDQECMCRVHLVSKLRQRKPKRTERSHFQWLQAIFQRSEEMHLPPPEDSKMWGMFFLGAPAERAPKPSASRI